MSEVIHLFPGLAPAESCPSCAGSHREFGALCKTCRINQAPVDASFVQSEIAGAIADLRRSQSESTLLVGPLLAVMQRMRKAYDASEPLVKIYGRGYVEMINGELWAFPEPNLSFGPFGNEESAQNALTEYDETKRAKESVT